MKTIRKTARETRRGFTLIEVLLVLVILGVLAALVVPKLLGIQGSTMVDGTKASIRGLEAALELYAVAHDARYPETLEDLLNPVDRDENPMPAYLDDYPKDAWKQPLNYEVEYDQQFGTIPEARIWSNGPNRQNDDGSGDDINNWDDHLVE